MNFPSHFLDLITLKLFGEYYEYRKFETTQPLAMVRINSRVSLIAI